MALLVPKGAQAQQERPAGKRSKAGKDGKDGQRHPSTATTPCLALGCPQRTDFIREIFKIYPESEG